VDCLLPPQPVADGLTRYRIRSKRIRGQPHGGTWDEWVVVAEVHHAVALPHRLLDQPGSRTHLFPNGDIAGGYRIRAFRDWANGPVGRWFGEGGRRR
jgi:hypothetical protein